MGGSTQSRDYAARKGFFVYVPTNGRLLKPDVIDRLADAGVATFNLAVDAVDERPGLPKALNPIRQSFEYLVNKQYRYGYTVFLNINICRNNLDDVRELTEIARQHRISTDYHICEPPLLEQTHSRTSRTTRPTSGRGLRRWTPWWTGSSRSSGPASMANSTERWRR
jgi:MoaA/NifB/PqqE/SkfB family radical SAM enzyme